MELDWAEPPAEVLERNIRRPGKYEEYAEALKREPGRWARMPAEMATTVASAQGVAQNIRRGKLRGFEKGFYESVSQETVVWARCKPEDQWPDPDAPEPAPRRRRTSISSDEDEVQPSVVRAWAREAGHEVPDRGRLPQNVLEAYEEARRTGTLHAVT